MSCKRAGVPSHPVAGVKPRPRPYSILLPRPLWSDSGSSSHCCDSSWSPRHPTLPRSSYQTSTGCNFPRSPHPIRHPVASPCPSSSSLVVRSPFRSLSRFLARFQRDFPLAPADTFLISFAFRSPPACACSFQNSNERDGGRGVAALRETGERGRERARCKEGGDGCRRRVPAFRFARASPLIRLISLFSRRVLSSSPSLRFFVHLLTHVHPFLLCFPFFFRVLSEVSRGSFATSLRLSLVSKIGMEKENCVFFSRGL